MGLPYFPFPVYLRLFYPRLYASPSPSLSLSLSYAHTLNVVSQRAGEGGGCLLQIVCLDLSWEELSVAASLSVLSLPAYFQSCGVTRPPLGLKVT